MSNRLSIEFIATGNELLDGTTSDTNTQRLALSLKSLGLMISRTTVIQDDAAVISKTFVEAATRSSVVIVSGGLGPTTDDITIEVAAKTFGAKLVSNSKALSNVKNRLRFLKRKPNPGNLKQALIPAGAKVLMNSEGTAPGIQWPVGDVTFFFLPGVPREFDFILKHSLMPFFEKHATKLRSYVFPLGVFGVPESEMSEWVKTIRIPKDVYVGFRTHLPENYIKWEVTASSRSKAERIVQKLNRLAQKKYGSRVFGTMFSESVLSTLLKKRKTVAFAESCTGGLASSMLTSVSGSSAVYQRGYVVYSNRSKSDLLGVSEITLQKHGAVSEETAIEMAVGARTISDVDLAVAITGIAGPTGGTPGKPVGTVWIAVSSKKAVKTKLLRLPFNRDLNQKVSAYWALQLLKEAA